MLLVNTLFYFNMTNIFKTECVKKHKKYRAKVMRVTTPHGEFLTPTFMPVGTKAMVNCLSVTQLQQAKSQIILGGNTYHMQLRPGLEVLKQVGGMHNFMSWQQPMLTDSGGFQVLSLAKNAKLCIIDDNGAKFKSPYDGKVLRLTPASSIQAQKIIGADIIMAFDQCTPNVNNRKIAEQSLERTHRWLQICKEEHDKHPNAITGMKQALFGIIQGGIFKDLRRESAKFVLSLGLDGVAIGGETIGFDIPKTQEILQDLTNIIAQDQLLYTMGVGLNPQNLIDVVKYGADIFDCVAPTRNARHGSLYNGEVKIVDNWVQFIKHNPEGRILIKKAEYATDNQAISKNCDCSTCAKYSRAYLHYLFRNSLSLYYELACAHNIRMMHKTCELMRQCILERDFLL